MYLQCCYTSHTIIRHPIVLLGKYIHRIYVHGHFTQVNPIFGRVIPSVNFIGDQGFVQKLWLNNMGIANPIQVVNMPVTYNYK